ncbi:cornifelin homolog A-like [Pleurodeles waltl]|uniref:cornifelin homolog A-like n=1 Tax=Pleurodeles waltl TaxID=8319 RepID=UPI0037094DE0
MAPIVTNQPQSMGYGTHTNTWHSGMMDCMDDMGICLCGTFVPCILMCRISKKFGENLCLPCLPGSLLALETAMRERWHIKGSICKDFFCQCFCGPCVLCRMAREVDRRH